MTSQRIQYGGRPPYWKSSFGYISTTDYPINAKFCTIKQDRVLTQVVWPKYRTSKIQDGGRPHFENGFCAISQLCINRFRWNLVYSCEFWLVTSQTAIFFTNPRWRTAVIWKIVFGCGCVSAPASSQVNAGMCDRYSSEHVVIHVNSARPSLLGYAQWVSS